MKRQLSVRLPNGEQLKGTVQNGYLVSDELSINLNFLEYIKTDPITGFINAHLTSGRTLTLTSEQKQLIEKARQGEE